MRAFRPDFAKWSPLLLGCLGFDDGGEDGVDMLEERGDRGRAFAGPGPPGPESRICMVPFVLKGVDLGEGWGRIGGEIVNGDVGGLHVI